MNELLLTFDIDWAPDFVVDWVAAQLSDAGVKATWFVTHASPAIERLRQRPELFELGIHPNFLPGSTHGATIEQVLAHCMMLVPEATSVRTHGLAWSSLIQAQLLQQTPITTDVSLFLPAHPQLCPVAVRMAGRTLWRVPYFWEDDVEMEAVQPSWHVAPLLASDGLKVFNFHPIHVYLNAADMQSYQALKRRAPNLLEATPADATASINGGEGAQSLFLEIIEYLAATGQSFCIRDLRRNSGR